MEKGFQSSKYFSHGNSNCCGFLTVYFETETFTFKKQQTNKDGHISILHVSINDSEYIIVNLYNVNTEKEQISALRNLLELLEIVWYKSKKTPASYGGGF